MIKSETGQALPLALVILAVGTLVIAPFMGHTSSSLIGSRIYGQAISEQYSADTGVEYAIWYLQNEETEVPQFTINNKTVNVTIEEWGEQTYRITSTATSDDGSSTTIEANVSVCGTVCDWTGDGDIDQDTQDDVCFDGDINVANGVNIEGDVSASGDITLKNGAEIEGDVSAGGDIILNNGAVIEGNVLAGGSIILHDNARISGVVSVGGDVTLNNGAKIEDDVYVNGDIEKFILKNNALIEGNIYITGNITDKLELGSDAYITGDVYATGTINSIVREENILGDVYENYTGEYPPPPEFPEIPSSGGSIAILTWETTRQQS